MLTLIFLNIMKNIIALDVSLRCTGYSLFGEDGEFLFTGSIETKPSEEQRFRLKFLYDELLRIKYNNFITSAIFEEAYFRWVKPTTSLYKTIGVVQLAFFDVEQVFYESTKIKKHITGKGNAKKILVSETILKAYPDIKFKNLDESDSFAVGLTHLRLKGIINDDSQNI